MATNNPPTNGIPPISQTSPAVWEARRRKQYDDGVVYDTLIRGEDLGYIVRKHANPPDLIEHLIPGIGVFMIHGQPRAKKSLVVLELLMGMATGSSPFGIERLRVATQHTVLYVAADDDFGTVHARLSMLAAAKGLETYPNWLTMMRVRKFSLDDEYWVTKLIDDCKRIQVRCIVFDPFRRITAHADKGPGELNPTADVLRKIGLDTGAVIGLVHHDVRPGTRTAKRREDLPQLASGGGIFGLVDAPIHVRRVDENRVEVTPAEYKLSATPDRFRLRFDFTGPNGEPALIIRGETVKVRSADPLADRIVALLSEGSAPSGTWVAKRLAAGKHAVLDALDELRTAGVVRAEQYGSSVMWRLNK